MYLQGLLEAKDIVFGGARSKLFFFLDASISFFLFPPFFFFFLKGKFKGKLPCNRKEIPITTSNYHEG